MNKLKTGDWIKADIIGLGFYEILSIDEYHVNVKVLRIFEGKAPEYKGHVTCCHHGVDKISGKRIKIDQQKWFDRKIKRKPKSYKRVGKQ